MPLFGLSCAMSTPSSERGRLEQELAGLLGELGDLRDQLESSPAGLIGHFRRPRLARQLARLERRMEELRVRWAACRPMSRMVPTRAEQADLWTEDAPPARALVIVAHPDDAESHAGGTVAKLARAGTQVSLLRRDERGEGLGETRP